MKIIPSMHLMLIFLERDVISDTFISNYGDIMNYDHHTSIYTSSNLLYLYFSLRDGLWNKEFM